MNLGERLKSETHGAHVVLDRQSNVKNLMSPALTNDVYIGILKKFHSFYKPMEAQVAALPGDIPRFGLEMNPLAPLAHDLLHFAENADDIVDAVDLPVVNDLASYVGYTYVKQGSSLGGKYISAALKKSLSLEPGIEQNFFYGVGDETMAQWGAFQVFLAQIEPMVDADRAVNTAKECFAALTREFTV